MRMYPPAAITLGQTTTVQTDTVNVSVVQIANESPYYITATVGENTLPIPAWCIRNLPATSYNFGGQVVLTPFLLGTAPSSPSSSVAVVTTFGPLEDSSIPVPMSRDVSAGVSGTMNTNVTGGTVGISGTVPVSGTVGISGTPSVSVSGTPTVALSGTPNVAVSNSPNITIINPATSPGNVYNVAKMYNGGVWTSPVTTLKYQLFALSNPNVIVLEGWDELQTMSSVTTTPTAFSGQTWTASPSVSTTAPNVTNNYSGYITYSAASQAISLNNLPSSIFTKSCDMIISLRVANTIAYTACPLFSVGPLTAQASGSGSSWLVTFNGAGGYPWSGLYNGEIIYLWLGWTYSGGVTSWYIGPTIGTVAMSGTYTGAFTGLTFYNYFDLSYGWEVNYSLQSAAAGTPLPVFFQLNAN